MTGESLKGESLIPMTQAMKSHLAQKCVSSRDCSVVLVKYVVLGAEIVHTVTTAQPLHPALCS